MPTALKMPLRLMTLGAPLELLGPKGEPYKLPNTKHLALLAYLILEPGDYVRASLTKVIWSSGDAGSMNDALSSLRGILGEEAFPRRVQRIAFDPSLVACDAAEFRAYGADLDDPDARRNALALYRGPFFEGFNTRGASPRYIRWVEEKREEMERIFIAACERECAEAAEEGRWEDLAVVAGRGAQKAPGWDGAKRWEEMARQALLPAAATAEPAHALEAYTPSATPPPPLHEDYPRAPAARQRGRGIAPAVAVVAIALIAGAFWLSADDPRASGSTVEVPGAAGSAASVPCGSGEAQAQLVEEVFHYGVRVRPGLAFAKRWTLQNTGPCTWGTTFRLHHVSNSGVRLSTTIMNVPLKRPIPPGDTAAFVLQMKAPETPGRYDEVWELRDAGNRPVPVGSKEHVVAMIRVPLPEYPVCQPGQGAALLLVKKYPDGTVRRAGEMIRYSWTLKNDDECAWGSDATLRYRASVNQRMSRVDSVRATRSVEPGQTYTFIVPMQTPQQPGVYQESWELRSSAGTLLPVDALPVVSAQLRVQAPDVPETRAPVCGPRAAHVRFVDENWLDSSRVAPGQDFTKRWTVVNDGKCAWPADYRLEYTSNTGRQLARSTSDKPLGEVVPPGAAYTFEVPMRGPAKPGFYREDWRFTDARGELIMIGTAPYLAALIVVKE